MKKETNNLIAVAVKNNEEFIYPRDFSNLSLKRKIYKTPENLADCIRRECKYDSIVIKNKDAIVYSYTRLTQIGKDATRRLVNAIIEQAVDDIKGIKSITPEMENQTKVKIISNFLDSYRTFDSNAMSKRTGISKDNLTTAKQKLLKLIDAPDIKTVESNYFNLLNNLNKGKDK